MLIYIIPNITYIKVFLNKSRFLNLNLLQYQAFLIIIILAFPAFYFSCADCLNQNYNKFPILIFWTSVPSKPDMAPHSFLFALLIFFISTFLSDQTGGCVHSHFASNITFHYYNDLGEERTPGVKEGRLLQTNNSNTTAPIFGK